MKQRNYGIAIAAGLLLAAASVRAETWTGLGNGVSFSDTNNWTPVTAFAGTTRTIDGAYTVTRFTNVTDNICNVQGGATLNVTGGTQSDGASGNTTRNFVGSTTVGTVNLSGGSYNIGHVLAIANGNNGNGTFTVTAGDLNVSRGGNSLISGYGGSFSLGHSMSIGGNATSTGMTGLFEISGGSLNTRVGVAVGNNGTFSVVGSAATAIRLGGSGADNAWFLVSTNGKLKAVVDGGGITPIFVEQGTSAAATNHVLFQSGALLDVSFAGSPLNGTWTLVELENGAITNEGLAFAPGVDTGVWSFNIDNSGANGKLTVTANAGVPELHWNGAPNGNWQIGGTANWLNGVSAASYVDGSPVTFNDSLSGTSTVNLTTTLSPASILVTNTAANYTFSGTGKLSGATALNKSGAGSLTLGNTGGSDFTGPVQIDAGTITLADASALGATTGGLNANGGTLNLGGFSVTKGAVDIAGGTINNGTLTGSAFTASSGTANAVLAGASAGLSKSGSGTLILANANTYDGLTTINGGIVKLGTATALGSTVGTTTFSSGTLDLNGQTIGETFSGNTGTFVNSNTTTAAQITTDMVGLGNPTFDGPGDIIVRNITHPAGVTRRTTKNGTGTLTLGGDQNNSRYGLTVNAGNVILAKTSGEAVARFALIMNNASSVVTFQNKGDQIGDQTDANGLHQINAGTLDLNGFSDSFGALSTTLGTEPGGVVTNGNGSTTSTLTLLGVVGTDATWPGVIAGNLALVKAGANTQTLTGPNTYTGSTTITGGKLALSGSGSLASTGIGIYAGAAFDVSGLSGGSYALSGSGTLILNVNKSGATLTQGQVVIGANNLTLGGSLVVTNTGDALVAGDSFTLVSKTSGVLSSSFSSVTLPVLGGGLAWNTDNLASDGVITVVSTGVLPPTTLVWSTVSPGVVQFTFPAGYKLIYQTNSLSVGLSNTWMDYPGGGTSPVNVTINPAIPTAFFGLGQ